MSFQAASPASHSVRQAKEKEPMTTATSGRLCLQQFGKSVPDGSWVRTFSELLIGMPGWYSSRCALTWKTKATKSNRLYFQLVASTLPTADTEPSLLPTVTTTNANQGLQSTNNAGKPLLPRAAMLLKTPCAMDGTMTSGKKNPVSGSSGTLAQEIMSGFVYRRGILPTPNAVEGTKWARTYNPNSQMGKGLSAMAVNGLLPTPLSTEITHTNRNRMLKEKGGQTVGSRKNGEQRLNGLMDYLMFHNILPTPEASNYKNGHRTASPRIERKMAQGWTIGLNDLATLNLLPNNTSELSGKTSQLNPLFVEEMMGFPSGWILLPFLKESLL